jgi:hypothetical protein
LTQINYALSNFLSDVEVVLERYRYPLIEFDETRSEPAIDCRSGWSTIPMIVSTKAEAPPQTIFVLEADGEY